MEQMYQKDYIDELLDYNSILLSRSATTYRVHSPIHFNHNLYHTDNYSTLQRSRPSLNRNNSTLQSLNRNNSTLQRSRLSFIYETNFKEEQEDIVNMYSEDCNMSNNENSNKNIFKEKNREKKSILKKIYLFFTKKDIKY